MKLELDKTQLDAVTKKMITSLEKQLDSLTAKLVNRDITINNLKYQLKQQMDFSKKTRQEVREAANKLIYLLQDVHYSDVDMEL